MRELVVKYLSHDISRRKFVSGLTKAGLTATAANSVLASVGSVSLARALDLLRPRLQPRQRPLLPRRQPPGSEAPQLPA